MRARRGQLHARHHTDQVSWPAVGGRGAEVETCMTWLLERLIDVDSVRLVWDHEFYGIDRHDGPGRGVIRALAKLKHVKHFAIGGEDACVSCDLSHLEM